MGNENIKKLLKGNNITQKSFSKKLGLSLRGLEDKLSGKNRFHIEEIKFIKEYFNVSYEQIID